MRTNPDDEFENYQINNDAQLFVISTNNSNQSPDFTPVKFINVTKDNETV